MGHIHCKNRFGINSNYLSFIKEGIYRPDKGYLDNFIKTETSILAL